MVGARVSLYSGSDENTYAPLRVMELKDKRLCVDMEELKSLDCRYIFSRIAFSSLYSSGTESISAAFAVTVSAISLNESNLSAT